MYARHYINGISNGQYNYRSISANNFIVITYTARRYWMGSFDHEKQSLRRETKRNFKNFIILFKNYIFLNFGVFSFLL